MNDPQSRRVFEGVKARIAADPNLSRRLRVSAPPPQRRPPTPKVIKLGFALAILTILALLLLVRSEPLPAPRSAPEPTAAASARDVSGSPTASSASAPAPSGAPVPPRGSATLTTLGRLSTAAAGRLELRPLVAASVVAARGWAAWDPGQGPGHAAAGPALRSALGRHWRGTLVTVARGGRSIVVRLTDWCRCGPRRGEPTVIDLRPSDWLRLDPPTAELEDPLNQHGIIRVRILIGGTPLPPTDATP